MPLTEFKINKEEYFARWRQDAGNRVLYGEQEALVDAVNAIIDEGVTGGNGNGDPEPELGELAYLDLQAPFIDDLGNLGLEFSHNLQINLGDLDTIQDIRPVDTPEFMQVTLGSQADQLDLAVRADRELSINVDSALEINQSTFNLAGDPSWSIEAKDHGAVDRGVIVPGPQGIYGVKTFQEEVLTLDGIRSSVFSDWFSVSPEGWGISNAGVGDFRLLLIDELVAKAFTADLTQALAGSDILTKSMALLAEDFVMPSLASPSAQLIVEDLPGFDGAAAFEDNDWLRLRVVNRTSGLIIADVWGTVTLDTSYGTNGFDDGKQAWTFTVDYSITLDTLVGLTIYKGALALDYGKSGDTFIERTVFDRASNFTEYNSPYDRIVRWTGSNPAPGGDTDLEILTQRGNLRSITNIEEYGAYFKDIIYIDLPEGGINLGKNAINGTTDGFSLSAEFNLVEKDILYISRSATPAVPHQFNYDALSNLVATWDSGTFIDLTTSPLFGSTYENDEALVISFDLNTSQFTASNVQSVILFLWGHKGTDYEVVASASYDPDLGLPASDFLITNTQDYDEFELGLLIGKTSDSYGTLTIENIEAKVSSTSIAFNSKGMFIRVSDTLTIPFTATLGGSGGGGGGGGAAPVDSVFGRTGAVTAEVGDYEDFYGQLDQPNTWVSLNVFNARTDLNVNGENAEVLRLNIDRSWSFFQRSSGGTTRLALKSDVVSKMFDIEDSDGNYVARFRAYTDGTRGLQLDGNYQVGTDVVINSNRDIFSNTIRITGTTDTPIAAGNIPVIYRSGSGGSFPFNRVGNLIFQPRNDSGGRSIFLRGLDSEIAFLIDGVGDTRAYYGLRFDGNLAAGSNTVINSDRDYSGRNGAFSGNVGIGGSTGSDPLTVFGNAMFRSAPAVDEIGRVRHTGSSLDIQTSQFTGGVQTPITFTIVSNEAMRIDTSRNVGIGTSSPSEKLHVSSGYIRLSGGQESTKFVRTGDGYTELAHRSWGGAAAILWSARSVNVDDGGYVNGDMSTAGNTKHIYGASAFGSTDHRAKMMMMGHNNIQFYVSNASSGAGENVSWGTRKFMIGESIVRSYQTFQFDNNLQAGSTVAIDSDNDHYARNLYVNGDYGYFDGNVIVGEDTLASAHASYYRDYLPNIHIGWLTGLPQFDQDGNPTGTNYSSNQYGIWLRPGDDIVVDGEYRQKGGSWLLEEDAAIRIIHGVTGEDIIRLGRQSTLGRGLFFYDGLGQANSNVILQLVNDKLEVRKDFIITGAGGDYWEFDQGFQFGGSNGIKFPGSGSVTIGSDVEIFGHLAVQTYNQVNNPTISQHVRGWGNNSIDGGTTSSRVSHDGTERAIAFTNNTDADSMFHAPFEIDSNKIYRVRFKVKCSVDLGRIYVGIRGDTGPREGGEGSSSSNSSGSRSFRSWTASKGDQGTSTNTYFYNLNNAPTSYEEYELFILGQNVPIEEAPLSRFPPNNRTYARPESDLTTHVAIRFLNWNNSTSTKTLFIKDFSIVEVNSGIVSAKEVRTGSLETDTLTLSAGKAVTGAFFDLDGGVLSLGYGGNNVFHFDASSSEASIAGWDFNQHGITKVISGATVGIGTGDAFPWSTNVIGFQAGTGANDRIWVGELSSGNFEFRVSVGGNHIVRLGSIENEIAGWSFDAGKFYGGDGAGGYTGMQSGTGATRAFFTGATEPNGDGASFYARADGKIFHDSLGTILYNRSRVAGFGINDTAAALNQDWTQRASVVGASNSLTSSSVKVNLKYRHRFGINRIILTGRISRVSIEGNVAGTASAEVELNIPSEVSNSFERTAAGGENFTLELDVSSLSNNQFYDLQVILKANVVSTSGAGSTTQTTLEANLDEDILIHTAT